MDSYRIIILSIMLHRISATIRAGRALFERFASLHVTHSLLAEAQDACVKVVAGDRVDETL